MFFMHPQKYILGKETQKQVGEIIHGYGIHKVMIHFGGGSVKRSGLLDEVINSLREQGIDYILYGGVSPIQHLVLPKQERIFVSGKM